MEPASLIASQTHENTHLWVVPVVGSGSFYVTNAGESNAKWVVDLSGFDPIADFVLWVDFFPANGLGVIDYNVGGGLTILPNHRVRLGFNIGRQ